MREKSKNSCPTLVKILKIKIIKKQFKLIKLQSINRKPKPKSKQRARFK